MVNNGNSKISYALLARKQILDLLRQLKLERDFEPEEVLRIGELIQNYDPFFYPIIVKELEHAEENEALLKKYEYLLKYLDSHELIGPLIELFRKSYQRPLLRKTIIEVLRHYEVDLNDPIYKDYFRYMLEKVAEVKKKLLECGIEDLPKLLESFQEFFLLGEDEMILLMREIASLGKPSLDILDLFLRTGVKELIFETIREIAKIRDRKSVKILLNAQDFLPNHFNYSLKTNLKKMQFLTILKDENDDKKSQLLSTWVGFPYHNGFRKVGLALKIGNMYHYVLFVIDEEWGISKESEYRLNLDEDQLKRVENYFARECLLYKVSEDYAGKVLASAVRINFLNQNPFPPIFVVISRYLPTFFIAPHSFRAFTIKHLLREICKSHEREDSAERLWEILMPLNWLVSNERFKDLVEKWYLPHKKSEEWLDELLIRRTLREIIIPHRLDWSNRLLFLADFLYNVVEQKELIPYILKISELIKDNVDLLAEIPFFRLFILGSKKILLEKGGRKF